MENYINDFLSALMADGKSICTIHSYRSALESFSSYFSGVDINSIKYKDLREWANQIESDGLSVSTRSQRISAVKSFFRYLSMMELIDRNPSDGLRGPKKEKTVPKVISITDTKNVLNTAADEPMKRFSWYRDYTILATFLYTGIRRNELTNIKLSDVDMEHRSILIHGKGNKQRNVYINDSLFPILSEYISHTRNGFKCADKSEYLFVTSKSEKICGTQVGRIVNRAFEESGIKEKGVSAHVLRKRFATSVFQSTGDIATTSELLGHSSPKTTMLYVDIGEAHKRMAANSVVF